MGPTATDGGSGSQHGAVYIFTRSGSTWSLQDEISGTNHSDNTGFESDTLGSGDWFGYSVSLDSNTLAVGAYRDDGGSGSQHGAVYIFTRSGSTWSLQDEISGTNHSDNTGFESDTLKSSDYFGYSVSLDSNTLAVGAWQDNGHKANDTGAVYVFVRSGSVWSLKQEMSKQPNALTMPQKQ